MGEIQSRINTIQPNRLFQRPEPVDRVDRGNQKESKIEKENHINQSVNTAAILSTKAFAQRLLLTFEYKFNHHNKNVDFGR